MFDGEAFGNQVVEAVRGYVDRVTAPLRDRIAELEAQQAKALQYHGVHQRALTYHKGAAVTHGGGLWVAIADVPDGEAPGDSGAWQLAVKTAR